MVYHNGSLQYWPKCELITQHSYSPKAFQCCYKSLGRILNIFVPNDEGLKNWYIKRFA